MKGLPIAALVALLAVAFDSRPADAFAACNNNVGMAPRPGSVVPKYPKLVVFNDSEWQSKADYSAQIDGKAIGIRKTTKFVTPYYMTLLEVVSEKTGTLVIFRGSQMQEVARYTIKADAKLPGKDVEVVGVPRRMTRNIQHSTVKELYDALAIDLPDDLAVISATVKIRRDNKAPWQEFDLPVNTGDWMEKGKNVIRIGQLGCKSNYSVGLLEQGVDLEATVTLADGSTRKVKLPGKRTTLLKSTNPLDKDDE